MISNRVIVVAGLLLMALGLTPAEAFNPDKGQVYKKNTLKRAYEKNIRPKRGYYHVDTPLIEKRIFSQHGRIRAAWRSGDSDRIELGRLRGRLRQIEDVRYEYASDGVITRYERHRLHRLLKLNSRRIARARYGWKWWAYEIARPYRSLSAY